MIYQVCCFGDICRDSPCIVVNVEYRLAPEHKFPSNNDDAKCVVEWVAKNKTAVGKIYIFHPCCNHIFVQTCSLLCVNHIPDRSILRYELIS